MRRQGIEPQARQLTVFFANDRLEKIEGDPMPSESEFVTLLGKGRTMGKVPQLEASEESLKAFAKSSPAPEAAAVATPEVPAPTNTSYPPLESSVR
jgi:outer membrane protein assembly factor BamE